MNGKEYISELCTRGIIDGNIAERLNGYCCKVFVAVVQEPMASLDDTGTKVKAFHRKEDADAWVDEILAQYEEEGYYNRADDILNHEIYQLEVK